MERIRFLDYTIVNSGNNDGYVLMKPNGQLWECHLGNYGSLNEAKKAAILHFMIARPHIFATTIYYRTIGIGGQHCEFSLLKHQLDKEGIEVPEELKEQSTVMYQEGNITCTKNCMTFKNEIIGFDKIKYEHK